MARAECCYCEVDDIKEDLGDQWVAGAKHDRALESGILMASRLIDAHQGWEDCHYAASELAVTTRLYASAGGYAKTVDRFLDDAGLVVEIDEGDDGTFVTWVQDTDFIVWPYSRDFFTRIIVKSDSGKVIPAGQQIVRITGRLGGYTTVPAIVQKACIITVVRWFKRAMQQYQDTSAVAELGELMYTKALDPDVKGILSALPKRRSIG